MNASAEDIMAIPEFGEKMAKVLNNSSGKSRTGIL